MKNERIIFLDLDGCVVTRKSRYKSLDSECMGYLKRIVDETGAKIVISSSWKYSHTLPQFQAMLGEFGINDVISVTPNLGGGWIRGQEIDKWIKDNFNPKSFIILDDDTDMEPLMDRLIKTDCEFGLSNKDAEKAIGMLK